MQAVVLLLLIAQAPVDRRKAVEDAGARPAWAAAVAKFTWATKRGKAGAGSAVLVAPGLAMTAYHCVKDWTGRGVLRFGFVGPSHVDARRTAVGIVASSAAGDWAILRLDKPVESIRPLKMARKKLRAYDTKRMILAGYSCDRARGRGGQVLTYDDGCRLKKLRTDAGRILTDAICHYGASGGPAFVKDKDGVTYHWIGLVSGNINEHDPRNIVTYAVYQNVYQAALRRALKTPIK